MRISDWSSDVCSSDLEPWSIQKAVEPLGCAARSQRLHDRPGQLDRRILALRHGVAPPLLVGCHDRAARQLFGHLHPRTRVGRCGEIQVAGTDMQVAGADSQREPRLVTRSAEHTSELQSLMRNQYDV